MTAYYNEIDKYNAAWLRELINAGLIAPGVVDERSIEDVKPDDLAGYTQCHFFAGIGGWSYALRLAGWPDNKPIWTASCPCQPFSSAGKSAGFDDERHLWPSVHWLSSQQGPGIIIGEQVASKAAEPWLDLVQADLEALDYAFGAVAFPSASVGAPHIRDRTYWVADANAAGASRLGKFSRESSTTERIWGGFADSGKSYWVANGESIGRGKECQDLGGLATRSGKEGKPAGCLPSGTIGRLGHADSEHTRWNAGAGPGAQKTSQYRPVGDLFESSGAVDRPGPVNGFWGAADWLSCRDGKWRPVEPGTFPLADGFTGAVGRVRADQERLSKIPPRKDQGSRVGRLRGYGNAINVVQAAEFIKAIGV